MSENCSVEHDVRNGVDSVKTKDQLFFFQKILRHIEMCHVLKIISDDLQCFQLIVPVVGIVHPPVCKKIPVHTSGNHCRNPVVYTAACHLPIVVQQFLSHCFIPLSASDIALFFREESIRFLHLTLTYQIQYGMSRV